MKSREERRRSPRRDEAKADTRRRVLAAALEVFAREGYHAARMDAIAEAAGASKGALYFHFPGKLELFSALVDEFASELAADVAATIAAHRGGVARVEAAVTAALAVFGRRQALARIVLIEASSLGPAYAQKRREVLGRFAALVRHHLDEAIAEGSIPPVDTRVAAYAWLGALNEVVLQSLQGELPALAETAPALSALLLRSVDAMGAVAGR
jgi:TetR/AcrR family transcriptional regulator, fatty acid metabolism regulator protein